MDLLDFSIFLTLQLPKDARGGGRASCAGVPTIPQDSFGFFNFEGFPSRHQLTLEFFGGRFPEVGEQTKKGDRGFLERLNQDPVTTLEF